MDYPLIKSDEYDLFEGKFTDGVPGVREPSVIPAETTNAIIDELLAIILAGGIAPNEGNFTQVRDAIKILISRMGGGYLSKNVAGNANIVLTEVEAENSTLRFSGALTGNIEVQLPHSDKHWYVINDTTGNYSLTLKTSAVGSGTVVVPQGRMRHIYAYSNSSLIIIDDGQATETISGLAKVATQAQTNAGTDDTAFVTAKKLRAGISILSSSTSMAILFPQSMGGLCIQAGVQTTALSAGGTRTITFPIAFPNTCLAVLQQPTFQTSNQSNWKTHNITKSNFQAINSGATPDVSFWLAIGL